MKKRAYIKDGTGKYIPCFVEEEEMKNNPEIVLRVDALFGSYTFSDEEHIDNAKEHVLEELVSIIRECAKHEEFWVIKTADDHWNDYVSGPFGVLDKEEWLEDQPKEIRDGKCTVAAKIHFPEMDGYFPMDEAMRRNDMLDGIRVV